MSTGGGNGQIDLNLVAGVAGCAEMEAQGIN